MTVETRIQVTGVKDALRELNRMDKSARRKLTSDYKQIVQPTLTTAKGMTPARAPMSGWNRSWDPQAGRQGGSTGRQVLPYEPMKANRAIQPFISGKRPKEFAGIVRNLSAFGVTWRSPAAVLFDQANNWSTPQGEQMVKVLRERYGDPSRVMWRAWEQTEDDVMGNIKQLIEDLMFEVGQRIRVGL